MKNVTILTGEPTIIPIAEMNLIPLGIEDMMDWVQVHRPECLPEVEEGQLPNWQQLFPHPLEEPVDVPEDASILPMRGLTHNELLVELCGRKCYDSFGLKAGKKTNKEYIANTQGGDIPHACYDAATEVLTADGWKSWDAVTRDDRLASRTPTGELVYEHPTALTAQHYKGRMYRVDGQFVDLLVTPNHRMYVCLTAALEGRKRENFEFITAEDLDGQSHCYVKDAVWTQGLRSDQYTRDVFALLGFAIGDGTMGRAERYDHSLRFHLKKLRKVSWLRAVTTRLGWELREQAHDSYVVFVPEDMRSFFRAIYDDNREKQIPPGILLHQDRPALEALLDGLLQSDGHVSKTNINYSSTSTHLLDQVQQLALHVGMAAHLQVDKKQRGHVNFIRRSLRPEVNRGALLPRARWEEYDGKVYCAQVPNGTLYVRRNGVPVWCGNSIMYHAKVSFFFAGISRRVSHEIIRNYVGADRDEEGSPSQESTRFTHHYGFFIEPPKYSSEEFGAYDSPEQISMRVRFRRAMETSYKYYLEAVQAECASWELAHGKPPTSIDKKRIYEAASSFLPHQAETSMIWTTNPAAIAKFVRERENSSSDLEIQRFARKLRKISVGRYPNLFPQEFMNRKD